MQMITRRSAVTGIAGSVLLSVAPARAQQFTMKLSQPTINDVTYEYFKRMKAGIEQRSAGKIKVDIYPANQLGQLPAVVEGVALGTIEAAASANGFWISLEPRFQVLDAPGLFDSVMHGYKMLNDPDIRARMATWGADKGVEVLAPGLYSPLMLLEPQGGPHGRRLPGAENPHAGRRADPGRTAQEGGRHSGVAAARRGAAGDAEQDHRRNGGRRGALRGLQVLRHRQADDLSCRRPCLRRLSLPTAAG